MMNDKYFPVFLEILFGIGVLVTISGLWQVHQNHHNAMVLLKHYKELRHVYETGDSLKIILEASPQRFFNLKKAIEQRENPELREGVRINASIYVWWIGSGFILIALYAALKNRYILKQQRSKNDLSKESKTDNPSEI